LKKSELIVTKPYGNVNQDDFLNGAFAVETIMEPFELLNFLQKIELEYGRVRKEHWGPRTLDLDILFFDDMVIDSEKLSVTHIDMKNREFVLKPLCEIAPYKRHPIYGKTVMEIYEELKNNL
jgi:dihydroneopterin aldolase/2-amino-4-hydroxy-6-hydroxymethyldihydropteridine diphosphokinase